MEDAPLWEQLLVASMPPLVSGLLILTGVWLTLTQTKSRERHLRYLDRRTDAYSAFLTALHAWVGEHTTFRYSYEYDTYPSPSDMGDYVPDPLAAEYVAVELYATTEIAAAAATCQHKLASWLYEGKAYPELEVERLRVLMQTDLDLRRS